MVWKRPKTPLLNIKMAPWQLFFYNFLSLFQWIFGEDWCDGWHSFDVLASTASILNLCVISLDRYWAIEEPMSYPAKVSSINDVASLLHNFEPLPLHITIFLLLKVRKFQMQIIFFSILPKKKQKSSTIIVAWNTRPERNYNSHYTQ